MGILEDIKNYRPYNEQEAADQSVIISFIEKNKDAFDRTNLIGHVTASSWIVNKKHNKVLMIYHNIYNSWSWTGGHADGERDLLQVAIRECKEETGVKSVKVLSPDIFSLEVLTVDGHVKKGKYVPSHLHLNITYLLEADENDPLLVCENENSGVKWFSMNDALNASSEPWFVERIYKKLNQKLINF